AAEINAACSVDIPTRDFSIPNTTLMTDGLRQALALVLSGQPVYAGCMGGIGRTGLFLAILAKAWGIDNPVQFVRSN
ncbi:phosphatase domain-containing putative toxin, partial [Streptococcus pyogenes]